MTKIRGLKKAAGETKGLTNYYSGEYVQINYNMATNEVITNYHFGFGQNNWTAHHDENTIKVCNATNPMTMREIEKQVMLSISAL